MPCLDGGDDGMCYGGGAGSVEDLLLEESGGQHVVRGIVTAKGESLIAPNVVITTGRLVGRSVGR